MADSNLGYQSSTRVPGSPPTVTAEDHAKKVKREARPMSNKEKLSAYFTIAAAALGLISDGCKKISAILIAIPTNATAFTVDQNNLMTMANVRVVVL